MLSQNLDSSREKKVILSFFFKTKHKDETEKKKPGIDATNHKLFCQASHSGSPEFQPLNSHNIYNK